MPRRRTAPVEALLVVPPPASPDFPGLTAPLLVAAAAARDRELKLLDLNIELFRHSDDHAGLWDPGSAYRWDRGDSLADNPVLTEHHAAIERHLSRALDAARPLVGLTVNSSQVPVALDLAQRIKRLRPDALIVLGGPECFPTGDPQGLAPKPAIDFVITGEGEAALPGLMDWIEAGSRGALPAGVLRALPEGGVEGGAPAWAEDLDALPLPAWHAIERGAYREPARLPLMTSRGCPRRCVFCSERHLWPGYRQRGADPVFEEILDNAERYGATAITLCDSTFNADIGFLDALCHRLVVAGAPVRWAGQGVFRPEMHRARIRLLARAGCELIDFGLESGSDAVLRSMRKGQTVAVAGRVLADCRGAGIATVVNVMVGFPGETEADFERTLLFLRRHAKAIDRVNPCSSFCGIEPGSDLHREHAEFGVRFVKHHYFWETTDGENTLAVRLARFERLLTELQVLGLPSTYPGRQVLNRHQILGDFHANRGERAEAKRQYELHREASAYTDGISPSSHSRQ